MKEKIKSFFYKSRNT